MCACPTRYGANEDEATMSQTSSNHVAQAPAQPNPHSDPSNPNNPNNPSNHNIVLKREVQDLEDSFRSVDSGSTRSSLTSVSSFARESSVESMKVNPADVDKHAMEVEEEEEEGINSAAV